MDSRSWIEADTLTDSTVLRNIKDENVTIKSLKHHTEFRKVYNLTVDNYHSYFVGVGGVLGHNSGCIKLTKGGKKKIGNMSNLKDTLAADAIRLRGGGAGQVKQLETGYEAMTVGQLANMAAQGDAAAETAIKIIKQASKKAQKYGNK